MSERSAPDPHEPSVTILGWRITHRGAIRFAIGFIVSLIVGKAVEFVFDPDALDGLYAVQQTWIDAVSGMNPLSLTVTFIDETMLAFQGYESGDGTRHGAHIFSPAFGFVGLLRSLFDESALAGLLQLGLGVLAVSSINLVRTGGRRAFFGEIGASGRMLENIWLWPLAVVASASVIAFALQVLMLGALFIFQWLTGLAALAAGATGVTGVCWYCFAKLGEKGAEHALTPKI
jgi:hypothetical protein